MIFQKQRKIFFVEHKKKQRPQRAIFFERCNFSFFFSVHCFRISSVQHCLRGVMSLLSWLSTGSLTPQQTSQAAQSQTAAARRRLAPPSEDATGAPPRKRKPKRAAFKPVEQPQKGKAKTSAVADNVTQSSGSVVRRREETTVAESTVTAAHITAATTATATGSAGRVNDTDRKVIVAAAGSAHARTVVRAASTRTSTPAEEAVSTGEGAASTNPVPAAAGPEKRERDGTVSATRAATDRNQSPQHPASCNSQQPAGSDPAGPAETAVVEGSDRGEGDACGDQGEDRDAEEDNDYEALRRRNIEENNRYAM